MSRFSNQKMVVPNARNARLMATDRIRPFRRDVAIAPFLPGTLSDSFSFTMDVGRDGPDLGFRRGAFGGVTPDGQNGIRIESVIVFTTGQVRIELSGVAPSETRDIRFLFDSGGSEVVAFQGNGLWGGFNTDLKDYLLSNVGGTVPLVWEAIT